MSGEEKLYNNRPESVVYFRARTNTLNLNDRRRFGGGVTKCDVCDCDKEDLIHFILWCTGYSDLREREPLLQQPYIEDEEHLVGQLLFEKEKSGKIKELLYKSWKRREFIRTTQGL